MQNLVKLVLLLVLVVSTPVASAADGGEWYASWGYSRQYWAPSDIHVSQPSLGNDFTVHGVKASDFAQWDDGLFDHDVTTPQFNVRIGRFFGADRAYALELNVDHSKYTSLAGQTARLTGTVAGQHVDGERELTADTFRYWLHNGANHVMLNVVRRIPLVGEVDESMSLAGVVKLGGGVMLPHASNTVLGNTNQVGPKSFDNAVGVHTGWWELNGWTAGTEAGVRWVPLAPYYVEATGKLAYSRLAGVPVYAGRADQELRMAEWVVSVGYTFRP